ncbi:MAG TPA: class I poly(R)-hydroxyalkanoic acid synthase [Syntrophales bacterium]|nr:class I poly(R)-hydroxyalkanoic acid synthase [Syntrophales bacterium]
MDPLGICDAFQKVQECWGGRSDDLRRRWIALLHELQDITVEELKKAEEGKKGGSEEAREALLEAVRRQASLSRKYYAAVGRWMKEMVENAEGLDEGERRRALFWVRQVIGALNPANFFWTNPSAVQRFIDSAGASLIDGMANFWEDAWERDFMAKIVDEKSYGVGRNLAVTPGAVVYRNDLMELIQYTPTTDKVHDRPLLFIPPWINKYYIFDLSQEASFVRYMRDRGFSVFIISWRNPNPDMRDVSFDDYMREGALRAVEVVRDVCGARKIHAAGYCIGGTLLAVLMAWHAAADGRKINPVADWTLFSTLVDFSEPGEIGVFVSPRSVAAVEDLMKTDGYLHKRYLSMTFRLLGADNLIWRNFVHNYLYGGQPPKSDMLFWNEDGTHLPEAMCSFYLREFYLHNNLVRPDGVTIAGRPLDLGRVREPLYCVGTQLDHICPWRGTFLTGRIVSGPVRYVLSSEGHITGIINPPSEYSRRRYWAGELLKDDEPETWLGRQDPRTGSWWEDWVAWLLARGGRMKSPPGLGNQRHPPLTEAPGTYVFEK